MPKKVKESMKKRKVVILSMAIIVIALLLEGSILKYVNDKNAYRTSQVLLDRVVTESFRVIPSHES
mgnify:CR=1 FL=1